MPHVVTGLLLNRGKQFLAELLAGKHSNDQFGMFIEYYNGSDSFDAPTILSTRDKTYYDNLSSPKGYVTVPFVSTAALIDTSYKASFSGTVLPSYTGHGATLGNTSRFYSATLVYMPDNTPIFVRNFYANDTFAPVSNVANTNFTATINLMLG